MWNLNTVPQSGTTQMVDKLRTNKNIFELLTVSMKLLLDVALRESDPDGLINKLTINFLVCLEYMFEDGKRDPKRTTFDLIIAANQHLNGKHNDSLTTIHNIDSLNSPHAKVCAFLCIGLNDKQLDEYIKDLVYHKTWLKQVYNDFSFVLSEEMNIFIEFMKPISSVGFTIDFVSIDFDHPSFKSIDIALILKSQISLSSFFPDPLECNENYPELTVHESNVDLKNQNVYLDEKYVLLNNDYMSLKTKYNHVSNELKNCHERIAVQDITHQTLTIKISELLDNLIDKTDLYQNYLTRNQHLEVLMKQKDCEIQELTNLASDRKNLIEGLSLRIELISNDLVHAQSKSKTIVESRAELDQRFQQKSDLLEEYIKECDSLKEDVKTKNLMVRKVVEESEKYQDSLANLKRELSQKSKTLHQLTDRIQFLEKHSDELESALEEMGTKLSRKTLEVDDIKESHCMAQISEWVDETTIKNCQGCNEIFTLALRKHHCRKCGGVFCKECSANRISLSSDSRKQRVCMRCFSVLLTLSNKK